MKLIFKFKVSALTVAPLIEATNVNDDDDNDNNNNNNVDVKRTLQLRAMRAVLVR